MIQISPKQVQFRLKGLAPELKDAYYSEDDLLVIQDIGERNHLTQEKIYDLGYIVGNIYLGFIPHQNLEKELENYLHVPFQSAKDIGKEVRDKIFNSLAGSLEKAFKPLSETDFGLAPDRRETPRPAPPPVKPLSASSSPAKTPFVMEVSKTTTAPALKAETVRPTPSSQLSQTPIPPPPKPQIPPINTTNRTVNIPQTNFPIPPGPVVIQGKPEAKPIQPPQNFRLGATPIGTQRIPIPRPPQPKPSRIEFQGGLSSSNILGTQTPSPMASKEISRTPIHFASPKNIYMPMDGLRKNNTPSAPQSTPPAPPVPPIPPSPFPPQN